MTTTDFGKFGYLEKSKAIELLQAAVDFGFPDEFYETEVQIMMNMNSGYVFFTNADAQVCMVKDGKLEIWYTSPETGEEGFASDLSEAAKLELGFTLNEIENE